jgi:hypothetical protein
LLERTAGRRSFGIDAQSQPIIGETVIARVSRDTVRIAGHPQDLASARLEHVP